MASPDYESRIGPQVRIGALASVAEIPDFPFPNYAAFVEAHREGKAFVWVRYRFRVGWYLSTPAERLWQVVSIGSGLWFSLALTVWALTRGEIWPLWVWPAALLGTLFANPAPGCAYGCVPFLFVLATCAASFVTRQPVFLTGVAGLLSWFAVSAGLGMGDSIIREAMLQSETVFLWLAEKRAILRVDKQQEIQSEA
jgi:hypothetical protein